MTAPQRQTGTAALPRPGTGGRPRGLRAAGVWWLLGLAAIFAVLAGTGKLVTGSLATSWRPLRAEDGMDRFLALHRNHVLNGVSGFFSTLADTPSAIALAAVAFVAIRVLTHRWPEAVFVALALVSEVGVFLVTTLVIERSRPSVPRMDHAPPTSSFPSGHVAAAVALYAAVALVSRRHGAPWPVWLLLLIPAPSASRVCTGGCTTPAT